MGQFDDYIEQPPDMLTRALNVAQSLYTQDQYTPNEPMDPEAVPLETPSDIGVMQIGLPSPIEGAEPRPQPSPPLAAPDYKAPLNPDMANAVDPVDAGAPVSSVPDEVRAAYDAHQEQRRLEDLAKRKHADDSAAVLERSANEQIANNAALEKQYALIEAKGDAESAAHFQRLSDLAKKEPNPGRWWENQSGLGKALWAMSMVFGAAYSSLTPGAKNAALDMVRHNIDQDMAAQDARNKREMAIEELRTSADEKKTQRNLSDAERRHTREYTRIMALERAWMAKATAPNDLDAAAGKAEGAAYLAQLRLPLAIQDANDRKQAARDKAQRDFQAAQQERLMSHQTDLAMITDARERALAQISASMKGPRFDAQGRQLGEDGQPVLREVPSGPAAGKTSGVTLMGPDNKQAGDGVIRFRKEDQKSAEEFQKVVTGANRRYEVLSSLEKKLEGKDNWDKAAGMLGGEFDAEISALVTSLGTEGAKADDPGGKYTDKDFSRGIMGRLGFDPNGNKLERFKFNSSVGEIRKLLADERARMPGMVSQALTSVGDAAIMGQGNRAVWAPVDLTLPKVTERSGQDIEGGSPVYKPAPDKPVAGAADYLKRSKIESGNASLKGRELPVHFEDKVADLLSVIGKDGQTPTTHSPTAIHAEAAKLLSQLDEIDTRLTAKPKSAAGAWGPGNETQAWTPEQAIEAQKSVHTREILQTIEKEAAIRAEQKLKNLEAHIHHIARGGKFVGGLKATASVIRNVAEKKFGLSAGDSEVEALVQKYAVDK